MIVTEALWVRFPLALRRVSRGLAVATSDGIWLATWPWVGLFAPIIGLAAGGLVGAKHPGYEVLFIESLWLLIAIAVLGTLSGAVGLYFTIGFVIGDLSFAERTLWTEPLQYVPLLLLMVAVPLAAKSLAAELRLPSSVPPVVRAVVGLGAFVLLTGFFVYAWVKAVPLMLRPVHLWTGELPPRPIILNGRWVVIAAGIAALGRAIAQALLINRAARPAVPRVVPLLDRLPVMVKLVVRAVFIAALPAGIYENVPQAVLAFVVVLAAQFVGTMLAARGLRGYGIPRVARITIAVVPVYLAGMWLLPYFIERRATSFVPLLLLVLIAAVLLSVVNPIRQRRKEDPAAVGLAGHAAPAAPAEEERRDPPRIVIEPEPLGDLDRPAGWRSDTSEWKRWDTPAADLDDDDDPLSGELDGAPSWRRDTSSRGVPAVKPDDTGSRRTGESAGWEDWDVPANPPAVAPWGERGAQAPAGGPAVEPEPPAKPKRRGAVPSLRARKEKQPTEKQPTDKAGRAEPAPAQKPPPERGPAQKPPPEKAPPQKAEKVPQQKKRGGKKKREDDTDLAWWREDTPKRDGDGDDAQAWWRDGAQGSERRDVV